ncbi:MAG: ATP-binding protein [Isosphaeraceae bacterium]
MRPNWEESNQHGLSESLDRVFAAISRSDGNPPASPPSGAGGADAAESGREAKAATTALEQLECLFGLTPFERDILVLCAGAELERRFAEACAADWGAARSAWPTFGLALSALPDPHWSAISRDGPLRSWRLVEIGAGDGPLRSPLRIDERILCFLLGVPSTDERLEAFIRPMPPSADCITASHSEVAALAANYWAATSNDRRGLKPVLMVARSRFDQRMVTQEICRLLGVQPQVLRAADIPSGVAERAQLARIWNREALLAGAVLSIQAADVEGPEAVGQVRAFLDAIFVPVVLEIREGSPLEQIDGFRVEVPGLVDLERKALWMESLGPLASRMNGELDRIVECFHFDAGQIRLAGAMARDAAAHRAEADPNRLTWDACRTRARRSLENLAQRIEARAGWQDLVLPAQQVETLRQIVAHVRRRSIVHGHWGFSDKYSRGLGVTALFAGASGTGKTMASEVIARALDLDLYHVDLASVASKYIGETEKNLRRIFDGAEESGAVLLFDEADAIFGKRSEVRDSHDRYANLEISYLLQRMESYHGVAILTTNMKHAMDNAFLRRIRFIIQFPLPDAAQRRLIWERVFPAAAPVLDLDYNRLSQLNIPGGIIRNIATHAAFQAAEEGSAIGMVHILRAARVEYAKIERPLTATETGGWS